MAVSESSTAFLGRRRLVTEIHEVPIAKPEITVKFAALFNGRDPQIIPKW